MGAGSSSCLADDLEPQRGVTVATASGRPANPRQRSSNSRLFSSTSDQFCQESYNNNFNNCPSNRIPVMALSGNHNNANSSQFISPPSSPGGATKFINFRDFLQALPAKKHFQSVKQKLTKRFSADSACSSYQSNDNNSNQYALNPTVRPTRLSCSEADDEDSIFMPWFSINNESSISRMSTKKSKSRFKEHCKIFRDFLAAWPLRDLHCLVVEFEASRALSRLCWRTDAARCAVPSVADDLQRILVSSMLCDVALETGDGRRFGAHRAILVARSTLFRTLLIDQNFNQAAVLLPAEFDCLDDASILGYLRYLYSDGYFGHLSTNKNDFLTRFLRDKEKRVSNALRQDLTHLYAEALQADVALCFHPTNNENNVADIENCASPSPYNDAENRVFLCHGALLGARSSFFLNLIDKKRNEIKAAMFNESAIGQESVKYNENGPILELVLDESVIPRQYAPVILHAMYTDEVDLSLIIRDIVPKTNCLTEVQAIAAGKLNMSLIDEATELYQIARFLEFGKLAQGCENIIVRHISVESLPSIFAWSNENYGSPFVRRNCANFLCQEFHRVASSVTIFDLDESLLIEALKSDFVQASELEILSAVLKWGEHQLVKRLEEREPNILAGTTHSISRKGVRRCDLSDEELREVLAPLTLFLRTKFILPVQHPIFLNAQFRELICEEEKSVETISNSPKNQNCHKKCQKMPYRSRPRLFLPYYETAREFLREKLVDQPEQLNVLINLHPPLDVVQKSFLFCKVKTRPASFSDQHGNESDGNDQLFEWINDQVDQVLEMQITRKAMACGCKYHREATFEQARLKVLREHNLDESLLELMDFSKNNNDSVFPLSNTTENRPQSNSSCCLQQHWNIDYNNHESVYIDDNVRSRKSNHPNQSYKRRSISEPHLLLNTESGWPDLMTSSTKYGNVIDPIICMIDDDNADDEKINNHTKLTRSTLRCKHKQESKLDDEEEFL